MQNKFELQKLLSHNFNKNEMTMIKPLKERILKRLLDVSDKALREPRTHREIITRKEYDRLKNIWCKRYEK